MGGLASRFASSGTCSSAQTRFRRATCAVLRAGGPTPKHVAIVMDGNRRFAKSRSLHRARGHEHGADKLVDVLEWCLALGVEALSVYAFSTDNLKRDAEEKAGLFALAEARLLEIAASDVIREKKVRVRVVGDVFREANEIPDSLRVAAAKVTAMTWHHSGPVLNVWLRVHGAGGHRAGGGGRSARRKTRESSPTRTSPPTRSSDAFAAPRSTPRRDSQFSATNKTTVIVQNTRSLRRTVLRFVRSI
jgi:hypothetical protein